MVHYNDIKFDCRLYTGYKPCIYGNECPGCVYYEPWVPEQAGWRPGDLERAPLDNLPPAARILIIKTGALGDVLRTTTLLHPLKRRYPDCHITWLTAPGAMPLLQGNPFISNLLPLTEEVAISLRGAEFDALICLEKEGEAMALAAEVTAARHAGYWPTPWNTAAIANAESVTMLELGVSDEMKFHVNTKSYPHLICDAVGLEFRRDSYILELSARSRLAYNALKRRIALEGRGDLPVVGLNTGCGAVFRTKQWILEGWTQTARSLVEGGLANVVLMGGQAEEELNRAIMAAVPAVVDSGTDNPLEEFFGIVEACDTVVSSDSLGMHVAIAREKPVVALFGSTSHVEIDLYDRGEKVITDFSCSPCYLKTCDKVPTCMEAMGAGQVTAAVGRALDDLRRKLQLKRL